MHSQLLWKMSHFLGYFGWHMSCYFRFIWEHTVLGIILCRKILICTKHILFFFQKFQYGYVFILKPAQLWTIILNGIFFVCQNWSALRVCWADCFEKSWKTLWGGKYHHLNLINEVLGTYPSIWVLEVFSMEEWVKLNKIFF